METKEIKPSSGERMMDWIMKHVMPWFFAIMLTFCIVMLVIAVMNSV